MSKPLGRYSTSDEAAAGVDLTNKNVIITGSNSGIGIEAAISIAKQGANVIVACRDSDKTKQAVERIIASSGNQNVRSISLDLSNLQTVRDFVAEYNKSTSTAPVHILINNAGIMAPPYGKTVDGFESQFGTNHLGHFLLTNLLLPNLKAGAPSRVVNVTSEGHKFGGGIRFDDYNYEKGKYSAWEAYGQSKSANILFSVELTRRFAAEGITSNACHPGVIGTDLARYLNYPGQSLFFKIGGFFGFTKSPQQGASTEVMLAVSPTVTQHGKYWYDCAVGAAKPYATDPEIAKRLWELSEKLVGL